jgi:hypothetical protein
LQWHELPFHELIKFLNYLKEFTNLKWFGSSFHVLAAKYLKVLIPYLVVLVDGILTVFWYLKEYLLCLIVIKSCKNKGLVLLTILNVSMAIVLIRLIFKVGNLDFAKSSSYVLSVSISS